MSVKRLLTLFSLCLTILTSNHLAAQDIHFSQFWASPQTLNPALTGLTPCTFRAGVNYRNQWGSVVGPSSFQTYGASFDAGLFRGRMKGNMLGLGVNLFNDKSGDGILRNLTASLGLAYHQDLGNEDHYLSFGVQMGMVQKSVDPTRFVFEDMIDQNGVIPGAVTADVLANDQFTYLDINAGVHWQSTFTDNFQMYAGGAIFHLTEPVESFLGATDNVLNRRWVGHGGMKIGVSSNVVLLPSFIYMTQTERSNQEILGGTSIGFAIGETSNFYVGGYYRNDDAVIASTGFDFNNVQFGMSYDINTSDLSVVSGNKGGLEMSLIYFGCLQTISRPKRVIDCPRF